MKVNAILLKPLDGLPVGSPQSFDKVDFDRLVAMHAVREAGENDAVVDEQADADAQLLERLRHPIDGPRMLADLKMAMEAHERDRLSLQDRLSKAETAIAQLTTERDDARSAHAAAATERDQIQSAHDIVIGERDAARADLLAAKPSDAGTAGTDTAPAGKPAAKHRG